MVLLLPLPWLLVRLLLGFVLGFPLLLAGWALLRLRNAPSAGGLGRAYLLANYGAAVQLSNLQGEQVVGLTAYLISFQMLGLYSSLQLLVLWRNVPVAVSVGGVAVVGWLAYRYVGPAVNQRFRTWNPAASHAAYPPTQRRAWGFLGHACFWGAFTFVFLTLILREYFL